VCGQPGGGHHHQGQAAVVHGDPSSQGVAATHPVDRPRHQRSREGRSDCAPSLVKKKFLLGGGLLTQLHRGRDAAVGLKPMSPRRLRPHACGRRPGPGAGVDERRIIGFRLAAVPLLLVPTVGCSRDLTLKLALRAVRSDSEPHSCHPRDGVVVVSSVRPGNQRFRHGQHQLTRAVHTGIVGQTPFRAVVAGLDIRLDSAD
jgi:hypothetical protein